MYVKLAKKSCSVFSINPLKTSKFFLKVFLKKFLLLSYLEKYNLFFLLHIYTLRWVRYFDTVFRRPYRCFSIVLKVILSLSDRYKLFTSDWLWIEVCQNAVFSKIDITMTTINKNFEIDKIRILRDLDLLLKIRHQKRKVWCSANNLREKKKNSVCLNSDKRQIYFKPYIFKSRDKLFNKKVLINLI